MKQILLYILFSFFIIKSDAQVLKDFRITNCYYDSTDLYFEYEFVPLVDISVQKQKYFHPVWLEDMEGISLIAEKYDSTLKQFITIPFFDHVDYISDIEYKKLDQNKQYQNIASMRMYQFLHGAESVGGYYKLTLIQKLLIGRWKNRLAYFFHYPLLPITLCLNSIKTK